MNNDPSGRGARLKERLVGKEPEPGGSGDAEDPVRAAVNAEASKLKVTDLDAAYRLLDLNAIEDNGQPNTEAIRAALVEQIQERPWLKGATPSTGSGDGGARGSTEPVPDPMDSLIRQAGGRAT